MPETQPRGRAGTRTATDAPRVQVRYYRRMRLNRVYPVQVSWARGTRGATLAPVTVRLVMAGAQVVPLEQPLDPSKPNASVTFNVTPIAQGWLRSERLEVLQDGKVLDVVKLPAKVTSQRKTWFLLLLAIVVPFWIMPLITTDPLRDAGPIAPRGQRKDDPKTDPGASLTVRLQRWAPPVPQLLENNLPQEVVDALYDVPGYLGYFYNFLHHSYHEVPLSYYSFWILLLLALISWCWHRTKQKTRRGNSLTLARAGEM